MVIGSHNSWSYRRAARWWLRPMEFVARCQRVDIRRQYELGVRCFDLRIRFDEDGGLVVAHGLMVYDISREELEAGLRWLSQKGDCYVRVVHEVRAEWQMTTGGVKMFDAWCKEAVNRWPGIEFWCGRNLLDWEFDHFFGPEPECVEKYASVCSPRWIDDWWPFWFAWRHNAGILREMDRQDGDILLMDFVDVGRVDLEKGGGVC